MKNSFPTLTPLLRSNQQGLLLACLYLNPSVELTLSALSLRTGMSVASVMRDVNRLVQSEFLTERRIGRSRLVRVNTEHRLFEPLSQIVLYAYGPQVVIHSLIRKVTKISKAFIFGSWAERILGQPGPDPQDIDLIIVGKVPMREILRLTEKASGILGREVNVQIVDESEWHAEASGFLKTIKRRPLVEIDIENGI